MSLSNISSDSKVSNILRAIGIILLTISIFLIFAGLGWIAGFSADQNLLNYGMITIAPAFFLIFLSVLLGMNKGDKKRDVFTTIKCRNKNCNQKIIRDFKLYDYVFKELEEPCTKCNSKMIISEIASIPIKKVKDIPENVIKSKKSKPDKKEKNLKTITTLKCRNSDCDFKKDRDFQLNDYVFKIYNETCQKCGSRIYISEISHRDIKNSN